MKRIVGITGGGLAVLALVGGGWLAATQLQSPAQRAAAASPPPPAAVTMAVERGELAEKITSRADIGPSSSASASLVLPEGRAVVTKVVAKKGSKVRSGKHVLSINDRPVFALPGAFPLYRDLSYLDRGSDVGQLQAGLKAAGYAIPGSEKGVYGAGTRDAVDSMYRKAGFAAPRKDDAPASDTDDSSKPDRDKSDSKPDIDKKDGDSSGPSTRPTKVPYVPMSEVVIVRKLPLVLTSAPRVGTVLAGEDAKLEFGSTSLRAQTSIPVTSATSLEPGQSVTLGEGEEILEATIASVTLPKSSAVSDGGAADADDTQGSGGGDDESATVVFKPADGKKFPSEWSGTDQLAEITVQAIAKDALLVPSVAVTASAAGTSTVLVKQADGSFTATTVTELGSYGGITAIEPAGGQLAEGDLVRLDRA